MVTTTSTQVYRIEVWPNNRPDMPLSGFDGVSMTMGKLFFLQGDLSTEDVERLCTTLLCDPVVERYTVDSAYSTKEIAHTVDVTLLPGVTDPAAESLRNAAQLLNIHALTQAATGQRYLLRGDVDGVLLDEIVTKVLSNPVIQRTLVDQPISAPFLETHAPDNTVEIIALKSADDTALVAISKERRLSLDLDEMRAIRDYFASIERDPTDAELEMLAQTWSEHCVHKTFKAKISYTGPAHGAPPDSEPVEQDIDGILNTYIRAATEKVNKDWVVSAFVDDAGIVRFNDHYDLAFKVETHNRPSAIEPFGGANTGVGGVIRDVMGVSARPIANTDILFFGPPDLPADDLPEGVLHPARVAQGVVAGIEDYGNKMGIPTVNGAVFFDKRYTSNPLVFCGCLGLLPRGSHPTEAQPGDLIVVIGGRTGRDGLRGATFSSMEMDTTTATVSGGAVQIGHPIHEKQTLEVIMRARDERLYNAITDCGAGGLSSSVGEMGEDIGATVQLETVPLKYPGLAPWEIWLSEAQERMVLAVPKDNWPRLQEIAAGQDIDCTAIGIFEETGRLTLRYHDAVVGDISMAFLHDGLPQRHMQAEWNYVPSPQNAAVEDEDLGDTLLKLLAMPTIRSKEAIIRRYDHEIQGGTSVKPLVGVDNHGPSDATVLVPVPLTPNPSPTRGEGLQSVTGESQSSATRGEGLQSATDESQSSATRGEGLQSATGESQSSATVGDGLQSATGESQSSATGGDELKNSSVEDDVVRLDVPERLRQMMIEIARRLRRESTPSEDILWDALRGRQLEGRKFRRQQPVGAFVLDFYCASEQLAVEVDGPIHETQHEADAQRQEILESLGIRFVRVTAAEVETDLQGVLEKITFVFKASPSPLVGEGDRGGEGATKAVALSVGLAPQYTDLDPYAMAWAAVDEAVRNLVAVGADPDQIAILDNFSWGNTNMPDRLGALVRCAQGCHDAAVAYGLPFISGKDSLNNEYLGEDGQRHAIPGTLVISAMGIVPDVNKTVTMDLKQAGSAVYFISAANPYKTYMGGSQYAKLREIDGGEVPQPIPNAMTCYRKLHSLISEGLILSCHDVSEGGMAVALAEMCIAGRIGITADNWNLSATTRPDSVGDLFGESLGCFLVEIRDEDWKIFEAQMTEGGWALYGLGGLTTEDPVFDFVVNGFQGHAGRGSFALSLDQLERAWRGETPQPIPTRNAMDMNTQMLQVKPKVDLPRHTGKPKVLILHANGTNRDRDAYLACELAGGEPEIVHINQLDAGERDLLDYHMLVVPGGFSYGDDLGAGVLWSLDLRERFKHKLDRFIAEGRPVLGICNGFQTLVKSGLLPGSKWRDDRAVTLTYNERRQFECRWVWLQPNPNSPCLFTRGLDEPLYVPIAHGEGRVVTKDQDTLDSLWLKGLVPLTYTDPSGMPGGYPWNPNGSQVDIAGLCNPNGNVFGLMPHPENHVFPWQHPRRHRGESGNMGLRLFENGIRFA